MATSGRTKQSRLEKLIGNKIKRVKPKHEQPGYIKKLVLKQFELIEEALDRGCDFEDIADVISEEIDRSVSAITLKRYHLANRRTLQEDTNSNEESTTNDFSQVNEHPVEIVREMGDEKPALTDGQNEHLTIGDLPSSSDNQKNSLKNRLRERQMANSRLTREEIDNSSLDSNMFDDDEEMSEYNLY